VISGAALGLILTASQLHWLNVAYDEGQKYGLPHYTQAIILVESSACIHKTGDDGRSFGCGQLQVSTARKVCKCNISMERLIRSNGANIRVTAQFLNECFTSFWPDRARAIYCYNAGIPQAHKASDYQVKHSKYVAKVLWWLKRVQEVKVSHE